MQTTAGSIVALAALAVLFVSMWGLGKTMQDKNEVGTNVSAAFFAIGLATFTGAMAIAVNYPDINLFCV